MTVERVAESAVSGWEQHLLSAGDCVSLTTTSVNVPTVIITGSKQHLITSLGIVKKQHDKLSE
jgi:hypothetical protein